MSLDIEALRKDLKDTYKQFDLIESLPQIGSEWEHKNGNRYTVLGYANLDSSKQNYPVTIIYQGINGKIWARRWGDWDRSMTEVGQELNEQHMIKALGGQEYEARIGMSKEEKRAFLSGICPSHPPNTKLQDED